MAGGMGVDAAVRAEIVVGAANTETEVVQPRAKAGSKLAQGGPGFAGQRRFRRVDRGRGGAEDSVWGVRFSRLPHRAPLHAAVTCGPSVAAPFNAVSTVSSPLTSVRLITAPSIAAPLNGAPLIVSPLNEAPLIASLLNADLRCGQLASGWLRAHWFSFKESPFSPLDD